MNANRIPWPGPRPPRAHIHRPAPSVLQAGQAGSRRWVLEFEPTAPPRRDPLTGRPGSSDPMRHVRLEFPSAERAVAFARRQGWSYTLSPPHAPRRRPKIGAMAGDLLAAGPAPRPGADAALSEEHPHAA